MSCSREDYFLNKKYFDEMNVLKMAVSDETIPFWDNIIITTATQRQADLYEQILKDRKEKGFFPKQSRILLVPDRNGERIGSGGSTILALAELYKHCENDRNLLLKQKTLILHSGGDAKRMPHSAPFGKLFSLSGASVWFDIKNPPATIFDDLMVTFAGLPGRMNGGVVVVSADAFFRFFTEQIDLELTCSTAFAMKAPVSEGTLHGVFYEKNNSGLVDGFFHKLTSEELYKRGAVIEDNMVDLDIGLTYLGADLIHILLGMVTDEAGKVTDGLLSEVVSEKIRLSLYEDIISPMAREATLEFFVSQEGDGRPSEYLMKLRPYLYSKLHGLNLKLCRLNPGKIQNMGSSVETIQVREFLNSRTNNECSQFDINLLSEYQPGSFIGENCFIENSIIETGARVGNNCIISNCNLEADSVVPDDMALNTQKLSDGKWVCRVWGINDAIKSADTWLNRPIKIEDWDSNASSLWDAKLFPVCNTKREAQDWALALIAGDLSEENKKKWERSRRLSLAETGCLDADYLIKDRYDREDKIRIDSFVKGICEENEPLDLVDVLGFGDERERRVNMLICEADSLEVCSWQKKMRLYFCLAEIEDIVYHDKNMAESLRDKGRLVLSEATRIFTPSPYISTTVFRKWRKRRANKKLPIRVNFGGTWSDAPPYCFEHGGTMLNAAIAIDGKLPINVNAEVTDKLSVCFENLRDNSRIEYKNLEPLVSFSDPSDPYILYKSSLAIAGILRNGSESLEQQLKKLGGGIKISTDVDIPRGSGLGTSSILVAGMLDVLYQLSGVSRSYEELSDDVLLAEQLMTTGGGWQDAIGGVFPGIKLTYTQSGIPQEYDVDVVNLTSDTINELNNRGFLLYTGQRRLARSVLRKVTGNYVCNHKESIDALEKIQLLAVDMLYELKRGNVTNFGSMLSKHMELLRQLDPSSSNAALDYMMEDLAEYVDGMTLCGAAGGGFMYGILKSGYSIEELERWSKKKYNGSTIVYRAIISG